MSTKTTGDLEQNGKPVVTFDRPADRSLEAFKAWVNRMGDFFGLADDDETTEDEWREDWKEFWAKAKKE